jgi:alpha-muurolene/germacrene-A/gamma-muurolene synthase
MSSNVIILLSFVVLDRIETILIRMPTLNRRLIILPDLIGPCPFQVKCNPEYESVSIETDAWLRFHGIPYTEGNEKYNLWSALTFPCSSHIRLREACDVWTLLFLADDIMDSFGTCTSSDFSKRQLFQNMNECLQSMDTFEPLTPFAAALRDWWQRVRVHASVSCQQRLIDAYQRSNEACLRQVTDRKTRQTVPDLDAYIESRRDTSYGRVVCSFVDYSLDLELPDQCWTNDIFQLLLDFVTDAAAWTNVSNNKKHSE